MKETVEEWLELKNGTYVVKIDGNPEVKLIRDKIRIARENIEAEVARNNELKEENRRTNNKWLDAERKLGESREFAADIQTQWSTIREDLMSM